jgi:SSS family solute:Na+ symporter
MGGQLATRSRLLLSRRLIFFNGIFLVFLCNWYTIEQDILVYMAVSGAIYFTGAFTVLLFGLYWNRSSRVGAYAALIAGTASLLGLTPVRAALHFTKEDLGVDITAAHIGLAVTTLSLLLMVVCSMLFPDKQTNDLANE